MKIKSLILGSVAAAGLSAGAYAADLNVLTSLDVCDSLGITGLTISSDTNCLQISGGVTYEFGFGDFDADQRAGTVALLGGTQTVTAPSGAVGTNNDWYSMVDAWLKFVGTAESDFGPASATIKFDYDNDYQVINELVNTTNAALHPGIGFGGFAAQGRLRIEEAFVSIGDTTVIMAGRKGSIANMGDDTEFTWINLYNSEVVGFNGAPGGVETSYLDRADTGPMSVIQVVTDLGNGFSAGVALENLDGVNNGQPFPAAGVTDDGTFVGTVAYAGDTITAHGTVSAGGFLDGVIEFWGFHGGITATIDMFKFRAALAADSSGEWNAMATASATFDIFTLAAAIEGTSGPEATPAAPDQWGFAVSGSAAVTDAVTINVGGRWIDQNITAPNTEIWQIAASLVFAATETITLTGEVGFHGSTMPAPQGNGVFYGAAEVAWAPGGGYTTSLRGEAYSNSAYKITYKAAKSFK